jgi:MerR family transcriptional regulator, light-induced transcriptional regulator
MESLPQEYPAHEGIPRTAGRPECEDLRPALAVAEAANDVQMAQLVRAIEQQIIPRLMLAHKASSEAPSRPVAKRRTIGRDEVQHFAKLVLSAEEDAAFSAVLAYRAGDVSIESIYLDLLAPTARYLGDLWTEDLCNFTDVTVGLGRLQRVLRELSPAFGLTSDDSAEAPSVLLLPSPGEQHTFGLVMVGEFFRRAGWEVSGGAWTTGADAATLVGAEWFDAVGFSLGAEIHLDALAEGIRAVRQASSNPNIVVLVGGPLFGDRPDYARQVAADGMTIQGRDAPALAERLIAESSKIRSVRRVDEPPDPPHW